MDIDLGRGMDGTEAAQAILEDHDIPIVFLSSHTEKDVVDKTEKITSYGYVDQGFGDRRPSTPLSRRPSGSTRHTGTSRRKRRPFGTPS